MPRGPHESHGLRTTRWPTSSVVTAGPTSTTSATTSCPNTVGNEKYPLTTLSPKSSPKSMKTILASEPQMPVRRVFATAPVVADEAGPLELLHDHGDPGEPDQQMIRRVGRRPLLGPHTVEKTLHTDAPNRRRARRRGPAR